MKVSKCCNEEKKTAPEELTWDEMILKEGVYRCALHESAWRLIVIRRPDCLAVLYFNCGVLEPADGSWKGFKFVRTNETVCFEIK